MSDESNWQNHEDTPQRGGVTGQVLRRRHGTPATPQPEEFQSKTENEGNETLTEHEQAVNDGYDDKWHARFEHLPGVPGPDQ